jgi:hypothetical protein
LVKSLRTVGRSWTEVPVGTAEVALREFLAGLEVVVGVDWDVEEHPALLLAPTAFHRPMSDLALIYPGGFLLFDQALETVMIVELEHGSAYEIRRSGLRSA